VAQRNTRTAGSGIGPAAGSAFRSRFLAPVAVIAAISISQIAGVSVVNDAWAGAARYQTALFGCAVVAFSAVAGTRRCFAAELRPATSVRLSSFRIADPGERGPDDMLREQRKIAEAERMVRISATAGIYSRT
jgi:hypothetical protein